MRRLLFDLTFVVGHVLLGIGLSHAASANIGLNSTTTIGDYVHQTAQINCSGCNKRGGRCPASCKVDCQAALKKYQSCNRQCPRDKVRGGSTRSCNLKCQKLMPSICS